MPALPGLSIARKRSQKGILSGDPAILVDTKADFSKKIKEENGALYTSHDQKYIF